jgi:nitrogen-specific signal transduction histidine kinase
MEKDPFFNPENENDSFFNFLRRTDFKNPLEEKDGPIREEHSLPWIFFLAELVHRIKNPLVSIKTFTELLEKKVNDTEYRESFYKVVSDDIDRIDGVLNGLLNYVKVNTPLNKSNSIHQILEEALKRFEASFEDKKIKIFKRFEKDLPETILHDEQLRFVSNLLLQYILSFLPPHGSIGLLTKLVTRSTQSKGEDVCPGRDSEWIEILIIFTGFKKPMCTYETVFETTSPQPEDIEELELRLVRDTLKQHGGKMTIEVNEKKPRTLISLRLPIERRKVIYYSSANI